MAAKSWCDENLMAKKFVFINSTITSNSQHALQEIKDSLNIISMDQKFLSEYCKNVIENFKSDNVATSFEYAFNKELALK